MKKKVKWILMAMLLLGTTAAFLLAAMKPVLVKTETAAGGNLEKKITVQARMMPAGSKMLNAPAGGVVTEIFYQPGEEAGQGEVLLLTDGASQPSADLQIEQMHLQLTVARQEYDRLYGENGAAQAEYNTVQSQYQLAQKSYSQASTLAAGGFLPQAELDALKTQLDFAYEAYLQAQESLSEKSRNNYLNRIASYEKQLAVLEQSREPGTVTMPYDGVVWEVFTAEGAYIMPNEPVAKIYQPEQLKLEAGLLPEDAALLQKDMRASVLYADGSRGEAAVSFISKTAVSQLSSIGMEEHRSTVRLTPDKLPEYAGAGQTADVTLTVVYARDIITVPASAIVSAGEESLLYVVHAGKAEAVPVVTGRRESGRVEIVSGLKGGEAVITDPYEAEISQGRLVQPAEER